MAKDNKGVSEAAQVNEASGTNEPAPGTENVGQGQGNPGGVDTGSTGDAQAGSTGAQDGDTRAGSTAADGGTDAGNGSGSNEPNGDGNGSSVPGSTGNGTTTRTRQAVAKRVYLADDDTEHRNVPTNAKALEFRFVNGDVRAVQLTDLAAHVQQQAMWHGLNQKLGDSFASAKGDVASAIESFDDTYSQLKEGDWITRAEGGAAPKTMLVEALARLKSRRDNISYDDALADRTAAVAGWTDEYRKSVETNPAVAAELATIAAERAQERAKKAMEKVGTSAPDAGLD